MSFWQVHHPTDTGLLEIKELAVRSVSTFSGRNGKQLVIVLRFSEVSVHASTRL